MKTMVLNYKHKLRPTKKQKQMLDQQMFVANQVFNITLNLLETHRREQRDLKVEKMTSKNNDKRSNGMNKDQSKQMRKNILNLFFGCALKTSLLKGV